MNNPVKVHEDYGDWHPIVTEPSFGYYNLDYLKSVWEINEWFSEMYGDENLWFNYEEVLEDIVFFSPNAVVRGNNHSEEMLEFDARSKTYLGNETIKSRQSPMTYISDADLGFRIVRNK